MDRLIIVLIVSLLFLNSATVRAQEKEASLTKPVVSISFSRQVLQENDSAPVELWIANDSNVEITNVEMHVSPLDFLEWRDGSCTGKPFQDNVALGSVAAHAVLNHRFCVATKSVIKVGEFNILFTFKYDWRLANGTATSVVTYEKPIKLNIFGSDNVAGIPLAFAGFVVPGLFFWFVIQLFRAPWNVGVALGDKLIYSVLVSIFIVAAGNWISLISSKDAISVEKLIQLALIGGLLGLVVGSVDYTFRLFQRRRSAENEIALGESELSLLRKLLSRKANIKPSDFVVRLKNGEEYVGSMVARNAVATSLVAWFKIELDGQSPEVVEELKALQQRNRLVRLFDAAKHYGIEIQIDDAIQERLDDETQNTGDGSRQWANEEVAGITEEATDKSRLPLRVI